MSNRRVIPSRSEGTGLPEGQRVLRQEDHKLGAVLVLLLYYSNRTLTESHLGSTGIIWLTRPHCGP